MSQSQQVNVVVKVKQYNEITGLHVVMDENKNMYRVNLCSYPGWGNQMPRSLVGRTFCVALIPFEWLAIFMEEVK